MAIAAAFPGFYDLERSVTPTFLCGNRLQLSPHCLNVNKKLTWEVKKIFKISVHGTLNRAVLWLLGA